MTLPEALETAIQRHAAGQLAEAETLYRQILAVQPDHPDALHYLGVIAQQVGRPELAVEWIRKAIVVNPHNPVAYSNFGVACRTTGRLDEAIAAFRQALQLKPDYAEACNNLGNALRQGSQFSEATMAYRRALELKPDFPEAHLNLGNALSDQGRLDEAITSYRRAVTLNPDYPEAHLNLGAALVERGQLDHAGQAIRRALELRPDYPDAYLNLGALLAEQGSFDDAIAAYRRALAIKPNNPRVYLNLGAALAGQRRLDEAIAAYRRALELDPGYPEAHNNLGVALRDRGEFEDAIASLRKALHFKPAFSAAHSNLVFALHLHPDCDDRTISEEHRRWNRQFAAPLKQFVLPHANDRDPERRLHIGYVSPDFRDHSVGRFLLPLFEHHDRERFEAICYSGVMRPDLVTTRFRTLAASGRNDSSTAAADGDTDGGWRNTAGVSDAQLAEMIRQDGVDILVDLALHTADNRLPMFAFEPAPVQVTWLGYAGSSGLPGIDYRLTDACIDPLQPPATRHQGETQGGTASCRPCNGASEEPMRLPDCWCCYQPGDKSPEINALPALSSQGMTFGCLNNFTKVNESVLALWSQLLETVKGSRLLMFCPEGRTRERVRAFLHERGIGTERVELSGLLPRWEYLSLYHRIDLGLDPFPYNGMTTTCDALWMGVPVLTLPGRMPASRTGLSLLSNVGLKDFAANSKEGYLQMAVKLAGDLPHLANLRATLRARMQCSPLMDTQRFARNVETAYRSMWQRWCGAP